MANDPTWAEITDQLKKRVRLFHQLYLFCNSNTANWLDMEDDVIQALEGAYVADTLDGLKKDRAVLSSLLTPDNVQNRLAPILFDAARFAAIPERTIADIMPKLRDYMHANSLSVNSRNISFGTPAAGGSNVGTGSLHRLTVDENGYDLEGVFLEAKRAECVSDQGQVDKHAEVFEFRGTEAEVDFLEVKGSGLKTPLVALHAGADSTGRFLTNPSFEDFSGTAPTAGSPTTLTDDEEVLGWVVTTPANAAIELDTTYRGYPGQPDGLYSLRFTGNNKITQVLNDNVRPTLSPSVPIYLQVAIYRASSATGNVTIRFGAASKTVALATLTDNAWNIVKLDFDKNLYYKNYRENDLTMEVELDTYGGSGHIKIDDVIVGYWTNIDGTYYALVGGATPYEEDDVFTWSDALAGTEGILNYWIWRAGLGYLPSNNAGTETITDPT